MNTDAMFESRFQELIKDGDRIIDEYGWNGKRWSGGHPAMDDYHKWYTSTKNLVEKVCGTESVHYKQISTAYDLNKGNSYFMPASLGILKAVYEDFKHGLLSDMKALVTAEVFSDFIEQAEYFLAEGYKLSAAVLMRGVLEDSLRTLCNKNGIALSDRPKLDWMNAELAKKNVYNKNVLKQVTAWAGVGNDAAHMKPENFTDNDVKNMISGIIGFNATHLK